MNNLVALIFVSILVLVVLFAVYEGDFSDMDSDIQMCIIYVLTILLIITISTIAELQS